jgi:uncharacterized protein YjbI with pentapeptide repeats
LIDEVLHRLLTGARFDDLPVGRVDGRVDLRGFPVPVALIPRGSWRNVRLEKIDFSQAWLSNASFKGVTFSDCTFDRADCSHASWWGCRVEDCTFFRTNLSHATLGGDDGVTTWNRVSLVSADLRHAGGRRATFECCQFDRAQLAGAWFTSALRDCRFSGRLGTLRIEGVDLDGDEPLVNTDLTEADLTQVRFVRVDLRLARLPPDGDDYVVVDEWVDRLALARRRLQDLRTRTAELAVIPIEAALRDAAPGQQVGIISLTQMTVDEATLIRQTLASRSSKDH